MFDDIPTLTHAQQQAAVELIQRLMAEGMPAASAIQQVADQIRAQFAAQQKKDAHPKE